jgi:glycosyltransferase involved in cell wall biosynthesis
MAPVDVWLSADPARAGHDDTEWGAALPPAHGYHHPFRVKLKPVSAPVARAELGITDGQVVIVTVGARLPHEIDGPWAQIMLDVMARNPNAVWLLVGGVGTVPPALAAARPGQVCTLAQSNELRSIYRCCDLFVNPPRIGGGFSVAEAMGEGLPVLALAGSDAGSKLGGDAMADEASFFAMLEAMLSSPELRSTTGAEMRRRFTQTLDLESSGPSLRAACELALARFRQRYS